MMCDEINMWKSYWILFVFRYFKHHISLLLPISAPRHTHKLPLQPYRTGQRFHMEVRALRKMGHWKSQQQEPGKDLWSWKQALSSVFIKPWTSTLTVRFLRGKKEIETLRGCDMSLVVTLALEDASIAKQFTLSSGTSALTLLSRGKKK